MDAVGSECARLRSEGISWKLSLKGCQEKRKSRVDMKGQGSVLESSRMQLYKAVNVANMGWNAIG